MTTRMTVMVIAVALALVVWSGTARATANEHASCPGIALSEHGPAHEVRAVVHEEVKPLADALGVPMGALVSPFAHEHLGSHEACELAFGG